MSDLPPPPPNAAPPPTEPPKKMSVAKGCLIGAGIFLLLFIGLATLAAIFGEDKDETATADSTTTSEAVPSSTEGTSTTTTTEPATTTSSSPTTTAAPAGPNIGIDTATFVARWNEFNATAMDNMFPLATPVVDAGLARDVWNDMIRRNISILVSIDKPTNNIFEVTILGQPDRPSEAGDLLLTWGLVIVATNPNLSVDERGDIIRDLTGPGFGDDGFEAESLAGGVRYHVSSSDVLGHLFVASPAES